MIVKVTAGPDTIIVGIICLWQHSRVRQFVTSEAGFIDRNQYLAYKETLEHSPGTYIQFVGGLAFL